MSKVEEKAIATKATEAVALVQPDVPMGFEEEGIDAIIPRVKFLQDLSPEVKDRTGEVGDVINSLTLEKLNGKVFVPVFVYKNNIEWVPRNEGGGIKCMSRDGKIASAADGSIIHCAQCRRNEFDNTKKGTEAQPKCNKYINFFGFFRSEEDDEDVAFPIILSFARTSYKEGRTLYSRAKVSMQNMWNFGYIVESKMATKNNNSWYIPHIMPAGPTSAEERDYGRQLYETYRYTLQNMNIDLENEFGSSDSVVTPASVEGTEY